MSDLYSGRVTAADIRAAHEKALATSADPASVQRNFDRIVADTGGIEELARQWTRENLLAAYQEQIRPPTQPIESWTPQNSEADKARLRQLVERFPDLAREILGDDL